MNSRDANSFCKLRCVLLQTDPSYMYATEVLCCLFVLLFVHLIPGVERDQQKTDTATLMNRTAWTVWILFGRIPHVHPGASESRDPVSPPPEWSPPRSSDVLNHACRHTTLPCLFYLSQNKLNESIYNELIADRLILRKWKKNLVFNESAYQLR